MFRFFVGPGRNRCWWFSHRWIHIDGSKWVCGRCEFDVYESAPPSRWYVTLWQQEGSWLRRFRFWVLRRRMRRTILHGSWLEVTALKNELRAAGMSDLAHTVETKSRERQLKAGRIGKGGKIG